MAAVALAANGTARAPSLRKNGGARAIDSALCSSAPLRIHLPRVVLLRNRTGKSWMCRTPWVKSGIKTQNNSSLWKYISTYHSIITALRSNCDELRKNGTNVTVRLARREHTLRQSKLPFEGQEIPMEVAAFVLLSSIALWFAEEISRNQL